MLKTSTKSCLYSNPFENAGLAETSQTSRWEYDRLKKQKKIIANKRVKIPQKIELAVMTKSKGFCYCGEKGNQIHHTDGNNSNNDLDNLAFLCLAHHQEAEIFLALKLSSKKGLSKGLSPALVKKGEMNYMHRMKKRMN